MAWDPSARSLEVQERARSTPFPDLYYDCSQNPRRGAIPPIKEWEKVLIGKRLVADTDQPGEDVRETFSRIPGIINAN